MPDHFYRWSKDGWIRTGEGRYVHPEYGLVESVDGFWTAEMRSKILPRIKGVNQGQESRFFFASCRTMHEAMQEAKRYTERANAAQKENHG